MAKRVGRKSAAQTPAPKSDRIKGSKTNKAGSAASKKSASSIVVSDKVLKTLKDKADKYNENHTSKVSVNTLKAVFRRGSGAYSSSHRPTITGGAPNSRNAWSFARVNKFLLKKGGTKVKAAYVQDDDLMAEGGEIYMEEGKDVVCINCGWNWNTNQSEDYDKYVCHKCGFDNTFFYTDDFPIKLKQPKTLTQIADIQGVELSVLEEQLRKGIKEESEHTTDEKVAETIALHHLEERYDYYEVLEKAMKQKQIALPDAYSTYEGLKPILENQGYDLVMIEPANGTFEEEFKEGGVVVGKRHSEEDENGTGERFLVESTGQVVEVEGGEGVLCKESMSSDKKYDLDGEKLTGRQIASKLNHKYGGVEFAEGGEVGHVCGCRSKKYYHGGELPSATLQGLSGGEAVVTVKTMQSKDLYNFQGKKMNPRQILSKINADSGGKKFEEGGTIDLTKNIMEKQLKLTKMVYFTENILYS
jgi:hypothetical protein